MRYVRVNDGDQIELVLDGDEPIEATITPSGIYETIRRDKDYRFRTELFVVPDKPGRCLQVMALNGLGMAAPRWEVRIPVADGDDILLPDPIGTEEVIGTLDAHREEYPITLRHALRMIYADALMLAKHRMLRVDISRRYEKLRGTSEWLQGAWERYQLAHGMGRMIRRVSPGFYDDPYLSTCKPLPDGWNSTLSQTAYRLELIFEEYEGRVDRVAHGDRSPTFWKDWHAGWYSEVIPTIQTMAAAYGWTRIQNPSSVPDEDH